MAQARAEVVKALTTCPTTNQGWRLMNTAAFTMSGADHAIQTTAAKRSPLGMPHAYGGGPHARKPRPPGTGLRGILDVSAVV